ncbi:MAG: sigma 54-interacting transcriptional regulator [Deltaproteobacteria bacterium]|nr:sigma 54-interacting transcriptional regulator [Deltaproteobacteria bacterium]
MKKSQFFINLYIIIPLIFAGFSVLSSVVTFQLGVFNIQKGVDPASPVLIWIAIIGCTSFFCSLLLVRFLLMPSQRFWESTKNLPLVTAAQEGIKKSIKRTNELAHIVQLFDSVTDVLGKVDARQSFPDIIGESRVMLGVMRQIEKVAPTDSTVLIIGESGTGKELIANSIYNHSHRKGKPFIKMNCVAIPGELLESELFGYEKGAFTGAEKSKPGKFELADKGTIFLDEIADMPANLQAKLLRVLQEREIDRVGGTRTVKVDVRFIAATNKNIEEMVKDGKFREDLFYRLNVFMLYLPPLRERMEDIPLLADSLIEKSEKPVQISNPAMQLLMNYQWPGNIRELQNTIERATVICNDVIDVKHLPASIRRDLPDRHIDMEISEENPVEIDEKIREIEKIFLMEALKKTGGIQVEAAKILSITPRSLWHRVKKHDINVDAFKSNK